MKQPFERLVEQHGGAVLRVCRMILGVQTRTYRQVAELVGNPKAVRAVGTACAANPLPVVVPCHRVVRAGGTPGGYAGGPSAKKALLSLEAAA